MLTDAAPPEKPNTDSSGYILARWLFLRLLGLVYLFAFASLWSQLPGLFGENGILPAGIYLDQVRLYAGPAAGFSCPTLAWINSSNLFLEFLAGAGTILSLLVVLGFGGAPSLALLYVLYLSLVSVGRTFLQFQWDAMLLECGFLAIFFAPPGLAAPHWFRRPQAYEPPVTPIVLWLLRWLLFRVMFLSGAVKLLSEDPNYRNLTALTYHWYTQPLPTPVSWFMQQLPLWFQKFSLVCMFGIELFVPFLIFMPRPLRILGGLIIIAFQTMIGITGNYCFFNLLTISLCVCLFDDAALSRVFPKRLTERILSAFSTDRKALLPAPVVNTVAGLLIFLSVSVFSENFTGGSAVLPFAETVIGFCAPFDIANSYGVFAVMTTERHEIEIEGCRDGKTWLSYSFRYKPGDLRRAPPWVEPHQPRLDWQMWFAALSTFEGNRWFANFMYRLLTGSKDVLALLETNPFPEGPPRYVRASLYDYHFTDFKVMQSSNCWWRRESVGFYMPAVSLEDFGRTGNGSSQQGEEQ